MEDDYFEIPFYHKGNKFITKVSSVDVEHCKKFKWHGIKSSGKMYVATSIKIDGKYKHVLLHRMVTSTKGRECVDHINGDSTDNRRSNLRCVNSMLNQFNRVKNKAKTSSPYKGVTWDKHNNGWRAAIKHNRRTKSLGLHKTDSLAALAYDVECLKTRGDYSNYNFPKEIVEYIYALLAELERGEK